MRRQRVARKIKSAKMIAREDYLADLRREAEARHDALARRARAFLLEAGPVSSKVLREELGLTREYFYRLNPAFAAHGVGRPSKGIYCVEGQEAKFEAKRPPTNGAIEQAFARFCLGWAA